MNYDQLRSVNSHFNSFPYKSEVVDDWTPIITAGDCDSYATAKFEALSKLGWSVLALRLATFWVETGDYHLVLLADLDGQTWVLDNRYDLPMEYQLLPYKKHLIQIAGTQEWELA